MPEQLRCVLVQPTAETAQQRSKTNRTIRGVDIHRSVPDRGTVPLRKSEQALQDVFARN